MRAPLLTTYLEPAYTDEEVSEEFNRWKNLNSFTGPLTHPDFAPWFTFPI